MLVTSQRTLVIFVPSLQNGIRRAASFVVLQGVATVRATRRHLVVTVPESDRTTQEVSCENRGRVDAL